MKLKNISNHFWLALLSGILIGTSYIPFPPWALFFCMCPLWSVFLKEQNPKKIFFYGWVTQFTLAIIGFHWIPYTVVQFGNMPWIMGMLALLAFAALTNLHIPLAGLAWYYIRKKIPFDDKWTSSLKSLMGLALLTALFEKLNPQIFPWYMGYGWYYADIPAYQWADTIGVTGLSTLTFVFNAWILFIYNNLKLRNRKIFRQHTTYLVLLFCALNLGGMYKEYLWSKTNSNFKVLMVQPNIGNQEKQRELYGPQFQSKMIQKHFDLTAPALADNPDLVVWPETSIPQYMQSEFFHVPQVASILKFIQDHHFNLLTGAYSHNFKTEQDSNSVFLFNSNAQSLGVYKKTVLLAFGEYMPFSDYFPILLKWVPTVADFERGKGPHILTLNNVKIGPQICYEGLHPWFSQGLSKQNADIFVNVTNDSWFGHTFESYQHLYMTLMRAVEFRRPMVRVTNTGISAAVDANGKLLAFSPQQTEWAKTVTIPYLSNAPRSFYSYFIYLEYWVVIILIFWIFQINLTRVCKWTIKTLIGWKRSKK